MGDGNRRLPFTLTPGVSLVEPFEPSIEATGSMSTLDHHGGHALVPWARYAPDANLLSGLTDPRRQGCPGGDLLIIAEPVYVADLGSDEPRGCPGS